MILFMKARETPYVNLFLLGRIPVEQKTSFTGMGLYASFTSMFPFSESDRSHP